MAGAASPLHLVLGDSAAETLRHAISQHSLPGEVHFIPDDLGHGPLHDGVVRVQHMRQCYEGCADWTHTGTDAFAAWRGLATSLAHTARDVAVWRGENVSETVLLAMACWWLREFSGGVLLVELPGGRHAGTHSAAALAGLFPAARVLDTGERKRLSAMFEAMRDDDGLRRRWVAGAVATVPISWFDDLVIAACTPSWQKAARVVGTAMGAADPRDGLSDIFVCSRLQALIADGRVETDRPPVRMREYNVRLRP